jgi:hypothetical protein
VTQEKLREDLLNKVIKSVVPQKLLGKEHLLIFSLDELDIIFRRSNHLPFESIG